MGLKMGEGGRMARASMNLCLQYYQFQVLLATEF